LPQAPVIDLFANVGVVVYIGRRRPIRSTKLTGAV